MEAKIDNFSDWIEEVDPEKLKEVFNNMLKVSNFGTLNFMEHHFEPQGYTGLWLLAESHFALHTFPEEQKTYIELSSCNTQMYNDFLLHFKQYKLNELIKSESKS